MAISNYDLGNKIASIRLGLGLSQEQFAERIGSITDSPTITKGTVNNWEHGRNKPNKSRLLAISKLANISVDSLINDEYGFDLWEDATGYTKETIQSEISKLKKSGRIADSDKPQEQIRWAVNNLEGRGQTDRGAFRAMENSIQQINKILNDYYIDPNKMERFKEPLGNTFIIKPHSLKEVIYNDMTPQAYEDIQGILNEARYAINRLQSKYLR